MSDHTAPIFIIRHKVPGFNGVVLGVDFHNGRGSTSSGTTAILLMEQGHTIEGEGAAAKINVLAALKQAERESRRKEQAELAAVEKKPPQTWRELLEGAAERRAEAEDEQRRIAHHYGRTSRGLKRLHLPALPPEGGKR